MSLINHLHLFPPHAARQNRPVPGRSHVGRRQGGPGGLQRVHQDHHSCHHPCRRLCQKTAHVLRGECRLIVLRFRGRVWESDGHKEHSQAPVVMWVEEMCDLGAPTTCWSIFTAYSGKRRLSWKILAPLKYSMKTQVNMQIVSSHGVCLHWEINPEEAFVAGDNQRSTLAPVCPALIS